MNHDELKKMLYTEDGRNNLKANWRELVTMYRNDLRMQIESLKGEDRLLRLYLTEGFPKIMPTNRTP